jgi:hypothetical protein
LNSAPRAKFNGGNPAATTGGFDSGVAQKSPRGGDPNIAKTAMRRRAKTQVG